MLIFGHFWFSISHFFSFHACYIVNIGALLQKNNTLKSQLGLLATSFSLNCYTKEFFFYFLFHFSSIIVISLVCIVIHIYNSSSTRRDGGSRQSKLQCYFRDSCSPFLTSSDTNCLKFLAKLRVSLQHDDRNNGYLCISQ